VSPFNKRHGDHGFVGWLARPASNLSVTILFLLLCGVFAAVSLGYEHRGAQIRHDEHAECVIQARGLPAGHDLSAAMGEIHALLMLPERPGQAKPPPAVASILSALNMNLAAYTAIEAKQPAYRKC
jgi:hypothetical protein